MADISSSIYTESGATNTAAPPDSLPENSLPSVCDDVVREIIASRKRAWNRINATVTTTGAAGHYLYATSNTGFPSSYVNGEVYTFKADKDSAGQDDFAVNSLAAKPLYVPIISGVFTIGPNQINAGQIISAVYDSSLNTGAGGFQVIGSIPRSITPAGGGQWTAGSVIFAAGGASFTQDNSNFFYDLTNHRLGLRTNTPIAQSALTVAQRSISVLGADGDFTMGGNRTVIDFAGTRSRIGSLAGGGSNTTTSIMAGANQEMVQISSTGLGIGALPNFALDAGSGDVSGSIFRLAGNIFAQRAGNYNVLFDAANNASIHMGGSDPTNYYRNTAHAFQNINGQANQLVISGTGLSVTGGVTTSTDINITSGSYRVGGSVINTGNLSDVASGTWSPADHSGAGLTLTFTDCNYFKIGKLATVSGAITWPVQSNGTAASIQGLPFAAKSGSFAVGGGSISGINGSVSSMLWITVNPGATFTGPFQGSAAGNFTNANLSGVQILFTITYITN